MRLRPRRLGGFTLVELLVALTLMALLAVLGARSLRGMVELSARTEATLRRQGALAAALADLERDLNLAAPVSIRIAGQTGLPAWLGDGSRLEFSRQRPYTPPGSASATLDRVRYRHADARIWREHYASADRWPTTSPRSSVLLSGVRVLRFRYLGGRVDWAEHWPLLIAPGGVAAPLPRALAVDLDLDGFGSLSRVFLVAPP